MPDLLRLSGRRRGLGGGLAVVAIIVGVVAGGCVPLPPPPPPPPPTTLSISTSPALFPAFNRGVTDYVSRCDASTPVMVSVSAPAGMTVSVDNQPAGTGIFAVDVTRNVGQDFTIVVQSLSQPPSTYYVRCLPSDFPTWTAQTPGSTQAQWYVTAPVAGGANYPVIFDNYGVPIWWGPKTNTGFAELLPNGNIAWTSSGGGPAEEHGLDGSLVRTITNTLGAGNDSHDLLLLPNGDYVIVADTLRANVPLGTLWPNAGCPPTPVNVYDQVIQEVKPDGTLVWSWDTADHIPVTETDPQWQAAICSSGPAAGSYDAYHWNSIEYTGSGFIVSYRHLDAVYDIDQTTSAILWKLGGSLRPESLTMNNDPVFANGSHFGGQHDARLLPDGTVTLYDDGTNLGRAPRAARYQLDTTARTATLLEQLSDPLVPNSSCCGSARRLPGGDWFMGWGGTNTASELTPEGPRVFLLQFASSTLIYRVVPVPYGTLNQAALRAGMDAQYSASGAAHSATAPTGAPPPKF